MQTPGFTAAVSLSHPPRGGAGRTRMQALDVQPAVVPAQVDWERVSRFLPWRGGPRWLWEEGGRPCPRGQESVWIPDLIKCCTDLGGGRFHCDSPCIYGHFECQPIRLRVVA